jgi:6-phosphogluconolactonase
MADGTMEIRVFEDSEAVANAAADELLRRAVAGSDSGAPFSVALSGGSTPKRLFALLADEPYRAELPWESVHFFWGDERAVPPDHPDSNFGAAREILFSKTTIPAENVHRIQGELEDPARAAAAYEESLRRFFQLPAGGIPRFDLVFLGMGADGHTASLFPGSEALGEARRLAVAPWIEKLGAHRITLTCPVFNNASCILFLVSGAEKAERLKTVVESEGRDALYPAQLVRPKKGELYWYVDRAAAAALAEG